MFVCIVPGKPGTEAVLSQSMCPQFCESTKALTSDLQAMIIWEFPGFQFTFTYIINKNP